MKKNFIITGIFSLCSILSYSQNEQLFFQHHSLPNDPYKDTFIKTFISTNTSENEKKILLNYYDVNRNEALNALDQKCFGEIITRTGAIDKVLRKTNIALGLFNAAMAVTEALPGAIQEAQAIEAEKKANELTLKEQQRAEQQARIAQNKQKHAEFQAITNNKAHNSDYLSNTSSYKTQGNYNDLLTSDPDWNRAVQLSVQQYGIEKTREIVNQQRASSYQQSVQSSSSNSYNQSMSERIISAATSSRQQLKIKVRGNSVVAYSNGLDQIGRQNWISVVPGAGISKTGVGSLYNTGNLSKEFSYTANINGTQIYFDM